MKKGLIKMDEKLMQQMREILLDCYGVDIRQAVCKFSTQNYAFIFPDQPYMIRVSMTPKKERREILSELMWVDDLKQFKKTICEPETSLRDKIIEEFVIDGTTYRASMFRTARGNVQVTTEITPMFFICVGELLGIIHKVSADEQKIGMHYQRKAMRDEHGELRARVWNRLSANAQKKITEIQSQIDTLPEEIGVYGLCHGDFHMNNFFVEANNIWLFDFDSCMYTHYLYDVAAFVVDCLQKGYKRGKDCRKILSEDIMPYFKIGYCLNKECGEGYWDALEVFINYRIALTVMALQEIDECGVADNLSEIKRFYEYILSADDSLDAMTAAMKGNAE